MDMSVRRYMFVQQNGLVNPELKNRIQRLKKAVYGLKQAPHAWYECLTRYFMTKGYNRDGVGKTLLFKLIEYHVMLSQTYIDDIVLGSTSHKLIEKLSLT